MEQITHGDKNAIPPAHSQNSLIWEVTLLALSHSVSFLGEIGGFQVLLAVSMYTKWQRTGLVPCVFPALNLHRGANRIGKPEETEQQGKQQFSCSLKKRCRFSDTALAAKPSFVLQVRKLLPGVWSAHFSKRALAKCGIKGILIVIITSTCPLKYNSKYHLNPQPQSGNGVCF